MNKFSYSYSFGNNKFSLFHNSKKVGTGSLLGYDNLYLLDTIASFNESLHLSTRGIKQKLTNENSATLWNKRLCHIPKWRIERLVSNRILNPLGFIDFDVCVNCIKGKQTNVRRLGANRTSDVLELIHTNICGPFPTTSWNGQQYFITFIDNYSRYGYLYLIHENPNHWMCSTITNMKLKINLAKELNPSYLTLVVSTMVDVMDQVTNVWVHLLNS